MKSPLEPFYTDFGQRLRQLRSGKRLSQEELGGRLAPPVTRASIANIESAKQRVLTHTLCQLADALGVSPLHLLPKQSVPKAEPLDRRKLENELTQGLELPRTKIKRLAKRISGSGRRRS